MANRKALVKKLSKKIKDAETSSKVEALVKDNKCTFDYKKKKYRVHKPNPSEKIDINSEKSKKFIELLQEPKNILEEQLIAMYLEKGVDIGEIDKKLAQLVKEEQELYLRLYPSQSKNDIDKLEADIAGLRAQRIELSLQKDDYLEYCIEKQLIDFVNAYLLCTVVEVEEKKEWKRLFVSYEDYLKCEDEEFLFKCAHYLSQIIYQM